MEVHTAEFVTSAVDPRGYPPTDLPEICFAGRSNVGKSTLMNVLMARRRLVQVSSKPGKTKLVNFFRVGGPLGEYSLVDLPGYGYAKVSKVERASFARRVETYLSARPNLCAVVLLVDIRRDPTDDETGFVSLLRELGVQPIIVATKADKLARTRRHSRQQAVARCLGVSDKTVITFGASTGDGREKVWRRIITACRQAGTASGG